ncbi:MAG: AbrB/MazE/SpoVT family DNA-binding domain-containing protein [Armatimonadetes bacterium]|nr:AbrB/MazE/SpoVT family DNA-binding domain-containing protein [Armatimonadota bacterium]
MKQGTSLDQLFYGSVTVGERGQIVVPAEARKKYNIQPGDKVLVVGHPNDAGIMLCKIDELRKMFSYILDGLETIESRMAEEQD